MKSVLPRLVEIATNVHGTRSVQTLVDVLSKKRAEGLEDELMTVIAVLQNDVKLLSLVS